MAGAGSVPGSVPCRMAWVRAVPVGAAGARAHAVGSGSDQARSEQPVRDPLPRGRLQFVPEGAVAQQCVGAEQALDDGQRTGGVAVVQAFAHAGEAVRTTVRLVDRLQAGQRGTGQGNQQFLLRISAGSWSSGASTPSTRPIRC